MVVSRISSLLMIESLGSKHAGHNCFASLVSVEYCVPFDRSLWLQRYQAMRIAA